eukprot:20922-Heterococcus_DN1.PRE.3
MIGLAGMLLAEPFLLKLLYARLLCDVSTAVTYRVTPWSMRSTPALAQVVKLSAQLASQNTASSDSSSDADSATIKQEWDSAMKESSVVVRLIATMTCQQLLAANAAGLKKLVPVLSAVKASPPTAAVHSHTLLLLCALKAAVSSTLSDGAAATNADTREAALKGVFSRAAQQLVKHATATAAAASAADETAEATQYAAQLYAVKSIKYTFEMCLVVAASTEQRLWQEASMARAKRAYHKQRSLAVSGGTVLALCPEWEAEVSEALQPAAGTVTTAAAAAASAAASNTDAAASPSAEAAPPADAEDSAH